jgi:hypothetical protein
MAESIRLVLDIVMRILLVKYRVMVKQMLKIKKIEKTFSKSIN